MRALKIASVFIAIFVSLFPMHVSADATVGQPAPEFTLKDQTGTTRALKDLRGKFVVLEWTNPKCPFVRKHYDSKNMQGLQKTYTQKGVQWFTVSSNAEGKQGHLDAASAKEFLRDEGSSATALLLDTDGNVGKAYGARTTPHMFVIDPKGLLIYAGAIDDNDSTRTSTIPTAKNFVAAALDDAMAGRAVTMASSEPYGCSVKYAS